MDSVKSLLGTDFISKASSMLGEGETKVQSALSVAVPSVLTGVLNRASSGEADGVLRMAKETANSGMLSSIGNFLGNNALLSKGADVLKRLFGDRTSDVANEIANFSGIKPSSAASLLSVAAPAAIGVLGDHAESSHMNTGGFLSFLNGQKDKILNAVPSGLNLAGALGLGSLAGIGSRLSGALSSITGQVREIPGKIKTTSSNRWLVPTLIILAAIALLWFLLGRKNNDNDKIQAVSTTSTNDSAAVTPAPPAMTHETIKVTLPNGIQLDAYKGGIEDQLVAFLSDPSKKVDKNIWFDFDNLNFETNSATITAESMKQVQNIAAILKAFPHASIKIGGYTDKTGDEPANLKLSQARADAVLEALKTNGIAASQLEGSEGYGSQFAKVDANASDEERKTDRRIAVSPRKK